MLISSNPHDIIRSVFEDSTAWPLALQVLQRAEALGQRLSVVSHNSAIHATSGVRKIRKDWLGDFLGIFWGIDWDLMGFAHQQ